MRRTAVFLMMLTLSLLSYRDNGIGPPLHRISTIVLTAESVGIADATLRIHITDTTGLKSFRLTRDRQAILTTQYTGLDTTVTDTTLLRGRTYLYKAYRLQDSVTIDSSDALLVHTIDSASIQINVEPLVTEAELQITINDRNPIRGFRIVRDGQTQFAGILAGRDTTLFDTGLLPSSSHTYKVFRLDENIPIDSSASVPIMTLDTTNHDFTWQIDTIGAITSTLNDVAMINDNDIWAVGEIYGRDSAGQIESQIYNLARWDGSQWKLSRIYYTYQGKQYLSPIISILAFDVNDIWIGSTQPMHWNGSIWQQFDITSTIFSGYIKKIWALSSNDVFIVGTNGSIAHFNGNVWQKMESGTDTDLLDIWGSPDGSVVWACGWVNAKPTVLLQMQQGVWKKIYESESNLFIFDADTLSGAIQSVWTDRKQRVFALTWFNLYECPLASHGNGIIRRNDNNPYVWASNRVRGTGINNIAAVGAQGRIWHFNGTNWKQFDQLINPQDELRSVVVNQGLIVAVGERYYNGIEYFGVVYRGSR